MLVTWRGGAILGESKICRIPWSEGAFHRNLVQIGSLVEESEYADGQTCLMDR